MGVIAISPVKYGKLLSKALPKVIETKKEFDHFIEVMESLSFADHKLTPEEEALHALLGALIQEYDDRVCPLPYMEPRKMLQFLMEQRDLRQVDLVPVFGSRSVASNVINGKRELSKTHIRKLAAFFHVSPEAFL
jgi:HTH-type transcriptional regulator/antitoxin HigA